MPSPSSNPTPTPGAWAGKLVELSAELAASPREGRRMACLAEIWILLRTALSHYAHLHQSRMGTIDPEDHADLISKKASDLLTRLDTGSWRPYDDPPGRVAAFVSTTARNGLVDELRRRGRFISTRFDGPVDESDEEEVMVLPDPQPVADQEAHSAEFTESLVDCFRALKAKSRAVLFFRAFYEMTSREISRHPEVGVTPNNVDVILLRAREQISRCMSGKGFETTEVPQGAFAAVWRALRLDP